MKTSKPKGFWSKTRERYNASVLVMLGIPTLIGGLVASAIVLVAGCQANVLSDPVYWPAIVLAVPWVPIGIATILLGWFSNPPGELRD